MRNSINSTAIVTIICAASLTTSGSANAWDNGGIGYDSAHYREWTSRYLGFRWGADGWSWGPIGYFPRYRAAPSYNSYGNAPYAAPGCRC